ncbi:MAG TPA: DUF6600 domain-containing protein, partial [Pontiella sp.]|nr:DUF6600 domain-containing protein [Pontiella sp.]
MKNTDFFSTGMIIGVLAAVLSGAVAAQGEESRPPSDRHPPADPATNSVLLTEQPATVDTDSAYDGLVRLVQAGVEQSILLSYVENSLRFFELDADRIIHLTDLGVPSEIIEAAMERDKQLFQAGTASAEASQPAEQTVADTNNPLPEVTEEYLYDTLTPYGSWIYIDGYGRCWRPTVVTYHAGWRPYCDNGRWIYTDCGWYWMSDYSWGWAAFHYGRWFRHHRYGWCWWPDTVWAPSWVSWRYDRDYCGWAPLPPYTSCRSGSGIYYKGSRVHFGFNFGLDSDCYTFVATRYFCDPKPRRYCLDAKDARRIYERTTVFNRIDYDVRKQRVVNGGISPDIISTLSGQAISPVTVRHTAGRTENNGRREELNRNTRTLVVSRPDRGVSQGYGSSARVRAGIPQNHLPQQRSYAATAGRGTARQSSGTSGNVPRTKPSGA